MTTRKIVLLSIAFLLLMGLAFYILNRHIILSVSVMHKAEDPESAQESLQRGSSLSHVFTYVREAAGRNTYQQSDVLVSGNVFVHLEMVYYSEEVPESNTVSVIQDPEKGGTPRTKSVGKSEERMCYSGQSLDDAFVPCKPEVLGPRLLSVNTSVIETLVMPLMLNLYPEIGNGHVATVVQTNTIFMNGLYNGASTDSHRARIPSTANIFVNISNGNITGKFQLDMGRGVFSELYTGEGFSVEVRRYAHRELTRLLVTEVVVTRTTSSLPISLFLSVKSGNASEDIDFVQEKPGMWTGRTKEAEYPDLAGTTPVTVIYSDVPPVLTFPPSSSGNIAFFTSVSTDKADALQYFSEGQKRLKNGTLFSSHVSEWEALWQRGYIEMYGNDSMALETNAALYYLFSSLPLKADPVWPFVGMSPGGLAHGDGDKDYMGHVFWDQDTWMFPPLALLHADIGRIIVGTRLRTHHAAVLYANTTGLRGARYPWESAFTGLNTSPSKETTKYELHVTGDAAWMMRQYLQLTNDTAFLSQDGGYQVLADIADFWVSRTVFNQTKNKYEIEDVMGPDEYNSPVNNSVYTNIIAAHSMRTAQYAASLIHQTPEEQWNSVASQMYIGFDKSLGYHPEYDNYKRGEEVKQADVILLGFPLMWPMTKSVWQNDLSYYATVTPGGPAMTWGMFAINWLRLGQKETADSVFFKGTWNIQNPFKVWSENADGSGAYNFHTGMGGYLQSLLYGYFGLDLNDDHLDINPQLPPSLTGMAIRGMDYLGASLDVAYTDTDINVTLTTASVPLALTLKEDRKTISLDVGDTVTAGRQAATVQPRL